MSNSIHRVLIVEDDNIISLVLVNMIKQMGHEVVGTTTNGREAIELANELDPSLILMDIRLKGDLDGIETVMAIKEKKDVAVIYVTGNTDKQHFDRAKESGFVDLISKPFTARDLEKSLDKVKASQF
ncbi:response regulator [Balneola sp. MJW-20]|uniref:response regulator n=1 Tax=Gracilimonas aurantiaca TaxID=3234185 RepID=UPI0034671242